MIFISYREREREENYLVLIALKIKKAQINVQSNIVPI